MRKNRINLNLMYDHDPQGLLDNLPLFITEVHALKDNFLNLFLADLRAEDFTKTIYSKFYPNKQTVSHTSTKVSIVCNSMIEYFKRQDLSKVLFPYITAHVMKPSREIKQALIVVQTLKRSSEEHENLVNKALKYLSILVDSNTLFKESLGTYDLHLALMVAQASKEDPKEYMPFLNELYEMEENKRMYKIDMHLKLYSKALVHLANCQDKFDECISLITEHCLYREALEIYKNSSNHQVVVETYSDYLISERKYKEAGLLLQRSGLTRKAYECFVRSIECWQETLNALRILKVDCEMFNSTAKKIAFELSDESKHAEAADIFENALSMNEEAVKSLVKGYQYEKALNVISKHGLDNLVESCLKSGLIQNSTMLTSTLNNQLDSLTRYKDRLLVVRENKIKAAEVS